MPASIESKLLLKARRMALRVRLMAACTGCKLRKIKCNETRPCKSCQKSDQLCSNYVNVTSMPSPAFKSWKSGIRKDFDQLPESSHCLLSSDRTGLTGLSSDFLPTYFGQDQECEFTKIILFEKISSRSCLSDHQDTESDFRVQYPYAISCNGPGARSLELKTEPECTLVSTDTTSAQAHRISAPDAIVLVSEETGPSACSWIPAFDASSRPVSADATESQAECGIPPFDAASSTGPDTAAPAFGSPDGTPSRPVSSQAGELWTWEAGVAPCWEAADDAATLDGSMF